MACFEKEYMWRHRFLSDQRKQDLVIRPRFFSWLGLFTVWPAQGRSHCCFASESFSDCEPILE